MLDARQFSETQKVILEAPLAVGVCARFYVLNITSEVVPARIEATPKLWIAARAFKLCAAPGVAHAAAIHFARALDAHSCPQMCSTPGWSATLSAHGISVNSPLAL